MFLFGVLFLFLATAEASRKCDGEECLLSSESPQLRSNFTYPCSGVVSDRVRKFETVVWVVNNDYSSCPNTSERNAVLRVWTHSNSSSDKQPVVFVTRSDENIQTWKLPKHHTTFKETFTSFNHTICSTVFRDGTVDEDVAMYIDTFTSDTEEIEFQLKVEPVDNFELKLDVPTTFEIAANSPQLYYFKFPNGHTRVIVTASSTDSGCAIVSVQNATCPVNDVLENARSKGVYQTMTKDASLTITARETIEKDDFFVVIVAANPDLCDDQSSQALLQLTQGMKSQLIKLTVIPSKPASEYIHAIFSPIVLFVLIGIVVTPTFIIRSFRYITCRPFVLSKGCCQCTDSKRVQETSLVNVTPVTSALETEGIINNSGAGDELTPLLRQPVSFAPGISNDSGTGNELNESLLASGVVRSLLDQPAQSITVKNFLKKSIPSLEKQYSVYGWNTITVGIFYALPAFQLVLAEQLILNASGNQDTCYYNFKCSHPLGVLSSFNSIWSNIGYVLLGFTFIAIVCIRHYKEKRENSNNKDYGLPQFFGVYYAMGFALIMEGFMSSFYHICPSNSNFQFDTAFMYIIGGLLILKIFQTRHPDVHANAFVAFFSFAVVIFLTLIGIYEDASQYWATRVILFFIVMVFICIFSVSFYFYHDWRLSNWIERNTYKKIWGWFKSWCVCERSCKCLLPRHGIRFLKMVITVIMNIVVGLVITLSNKGVATIVLALFITNFLLFTAMYLLSKFYYKEPWTVKPVIFLSILAVAWLAAFYFFFNNVAQWEESPALSRELNKDCVLLGFYDNHDVWHFLSAIALFFSFLFVLTLDDGLNRMRRDEIHTF